LNSLPPMLECKRMISGRWEVGCFGGEPIGRRNRSLSLPIYLVDGFGRLVYHPSLLNDPIRLPWRRRGYEEG
jgi:hypothetical protein